MENGSTCCKKFRKFALPMQKIRKTYIANAKNKKNLHSQCKKQLRPMQKIKVTCNLCCQCKKYKKFALPTEKF